MRRDYSRVLVTASLCYFVTSLIGLALASFMQLSADFLGVLHGDQSSVLVRLFLGTAITPPLVMTFAQSILNRAVRIAGRSHMVGVVGLTVLGGCYFLGQLGEHIVVTMFDPATFDVGLALLIAANLLFPALMVVFGMLAWRSILARKA